MRVRRREQDGNNVSYRRHRRLGIGDGLPAIGLDTYPVTSAAEAKERVKELAKDGECAVIYLTEQLAREMSDVLNHYKDELRPAIILIPGREGSLGIGRDNIQRAIERAVGADIL